MSEMTTAEMVRSCQEWRCLTIGISQEKRDLLQAIAARLSAMDRVAKAAAEMADWTDDDEVNSIARPAFDALRAALKEAGYGT